MKKIRIGAGAGYSGDRIEPAAELAHKGKLDYLVFECLGERTIALAQTDKLKNPDGGFDPLLEERMQAVLPACAAQGVKIVTNMGAANPEGAARAVVKTAKRLGLKGLKVAAVVGDDVLEILRAGDFELMDGLGRGDRGVGITHLGSDNSATFDHHVGLHAEKGRRPAEVKRHLGPPQFHRETVSMAAPGAPSGNPNQHVKRRPHRPEHPGRRIQRRLPLARA